MTYVLIVPRERKGRGGKVRVVSTFSMIFTCVRTTIGRLSNSEFYSIRGQHICRIRNARVSSGPGVTARLHASRWMKVAARRREEVAVDGCKLEIASPTVLRRLDLPTPTSLRPARPVVFTRFLIISPGLPSAHKDKGARHERGQVKEEALVRSLLGRRRDGVTF